MGYSKGMVLFIDILGSKNRTFNELLRINNIFHKELETEIDKQNQYGLFFNKNFEEKYGKILQSIPQPIKALFYIRNSVIGKRYVVSFSDCAYIIFDYEDQINNEDEIMHFIHSNLDSISNIVAFFVGNGFLCRGGITFGEYYIDEDRNIIFGPAINEAYLLEQEAKMPRLIFADKLGAKLFEFDNEYLKTSRLIMDTDSEMILKDDIDYRYFLNYLKSFITFGSLLFADKKINFSSYYKKVKAKSLKVINKEKNHDIIAKHNWHIRYLETTKEKKCVLETNKIDSIMTPPPPASTPPPHPHTLSPKPQSV
jgi:hypothetical protein